MSINKNNYSVNILNGFGNKFFGDEIVLNFAKFIMFLNLFCLGIIAITSRLLKNPNNF